MMNSNIHCAEPSDREAANRPVAGCGDCAILLIDIGHQVQSHEVFHQLLLIKAVPPLAGFPTPSIPIRKNHDHFRYLSMPDEGISRLDRFATLDPVVLAPWRTMKQVEGGIPPLWRRRIPIGWGEVNQERTALPMERRAEHAISDQRATCGNCQGSVYPTIGRKKQQVADATAEKKESQQHEKTGPCVEKVPCAAFSHFFSGA